MALEERLRHGLEEAGRPADPSGVYEELIRRRERRRLLRHARTTGLALAVLLGIGAGILGLSKIFTPSANQAGSGVTNGRITYVTTSGEFEDGLPVSSIIAVEPDGSDPLPLIERTGLVTDLDWSPDGRRLVYGRGDLFVFDVETGVSTKIAGPDAFGPSWSPDAAQVAYGVEDSGIVVANADGSEADTVLEGKSLGWTDWSPDGTRILFVGPGPEGSHQGWDIYVMDADGTNVRNLTNTPTVDLDPNWSPDGSTILFRSRRDPPPDWASGDAPDELYLMDPHGSDVRRLTNDSRIDQSPAWSPDGTRIAFTSGIDETVIYTMLPDGSDRTAVPGTVSVTAVAWQPHVEPEDEEPTPVEEPTPSPTDAGPPVVSDIPVQYPVCNVSSIVANFVNPDADSTVYVATRKNAAGGCPSPEEAFNIVAVDADGDDFAESFLGQVDCTLECRAFSAPDIDGDGTAELLVIQDGGAVAGLRLYDVVTSDGVPTIVPVDVADPGDTQGGFAPGEQARMLLGGDAFELYSLRCGDIAEPDGPGIVVTSAESRPHDSPDAEWHAHETTLVLRGDGLLHVVDVRDFTEPVTDDPNGPSFRSGETLCGSNLGPVVAIP